ncbi:hypothetical protein Aperf_G00000066374 [Anoplocephala perfoliata]
MARVFGRVVHNSDEFGPEDILYSDWHCSVYTKHDSVNIYCDGTSVEIPCQPRMFCSNSMYLFILSAEGSVTAFSKSDKALHTTGISDCRSISVNDDELCCISFDSFLFIYSLKDFPKTLKASQPLSMKIKSVASGPGFALFLTPSGSVFSKGIGT